jgi:undecaprenyl diphosphate synthase
MPQIKHLGIIMDGNRRWAKEKNLPIVRGYRAGYQAFRWIAEKVWDKGIRYLTVFALSADNWKKRSNKNLEILYSYYKKALKEGTPELKKRGIRLKVIGRWWELREDVVKLVKWAQTETKAGKNGQLNIALNYSGPQEILDAANAALKSGEVNPHFKLEHIEKHLYAGPIPHPDLIIRTSGEKRLSTFLTWQSVYSEFYFTDIKWPDFTEKELDKALNEYAQRQRRFGGGKED